jgi:hypothetical protein
MKTVYRRKSMHSITLEYLAELLERLAQEVEDVKDHEAILESKIDRITLVPGETPAVLSVNPVAYVASNIKTKPLKTIQNCLKEAREKTLQSRISGIDPAQEFCGCLRGCFPKGGVAYQRKLRDEWAD